MRFHIPQVLLEYFGNEALRNKSQNGHIETLAIGVGYIDNDSTFMEELIFPSQYATDTFVEDTGTINN